MTYDRVMLVCFHQVDDIAKRFTFISDKSAQQYSCWREQPRRKSGSKHRSTRETKETFVRRHFGQSAIITHASINERHSTDKQDGSRQLQQINRLNYKQRPCNVRTATTTVIYIDSSDVMTGVVVATCPSIPDHMGLVMVLLPFPFYSLM